MTPTQRCPPDRRSRARTRSRPSWSCRPPWRGTCTAAAPCSPRCRNRTSRPRCFPLFHNRWTAHGGQPPRLRAVAGVHDDRERAARRHTRQLRLQVTGCIGTPSDMCSVATDRARARQLPAIRGDDHHLVAVVAVGDVDRDRLPRVDGLLDLGKGRLVVTGTAQRHVMVGVPVAVPRSEFASTFSPVLPSPPSTLGYTPGSPSARCPVW